MVKKTQADLSLVQSKPTAFAVRKLARSSKMRAKFAEAWLFVDRIATADDNAEHLYRHVRDNHPGINAFFVLERTSPDWQRLADEGYRLIDFHSPTLMAALINARHFISSQADDHMTGPQNTFGRMITYKFTCLQHGVTANDSSEYLNDKRIDCLITSTRPEYEQISAAESPYEFSPDQVFLTGMPRYDSLLKNARGQGRRIVIMPTWRRFQTSGGETVRDRFVRSAYLRKWSGILNSPRLATMAELAGYDIDFIPHTGIEQFLDLFQIPAAIKVRRIGGGGSIQNLFHNAAMLVTDFSSVAFDIAYLGRPVIYYQFDTDEFYGGEHTIGRGYFDFSQDGFGPVLNTEPAVLDVIASILAGVTPDPKYRQRAQEIFPYRDGGCCERVFNTILHLDR